MSVFNIENPQVGNTVEYDGKTYEFDGVGWQIKPEYTIQELQNIINDAQTATDNAVIATTNANAATTEATTAAANANAAVTSYETLFYKDVITTQTLTPTNYRINYDTGVEVSDNPYRLIKMPCTSADKLYITAYVSSAITAGVGLYDSQGNKIHMLLQGTGTGVTYTNYLVTLPANVAEIKVLGNYLNLPIIKKVTGKEINTYPKEVIDATFLKATTGGALKKYGIRWKVTDSSSACERIFDSVALTASPEISGTQAGKSDFDDIYPYNKMKRCNVKKLASGATKVTYEGENEFALDGSNGDVMIEIPIFYYERYRETIGADTYEYRVISESGSTPHPVFVENGKVLEKVYISAYESSYDVTMQSISGALPTMNETSQTFLTRATTKGTGFTLCDSRMIDAITNLMWIEYATRNSTSVIGHGFSHLHQAVSGSWNAYVSENGVNRIIVNALLSNNDQERAFPGSDILICEGLQTNILYKAKITSVQLNFPSAGQTTINFDGNPVDIRTGMYLGSGPQQTGQTDTMTFHTGRTNRAKLILASTLPANTLNSCKYRNIENLVGNTWIFIPDITFNNLIAYVSNDMTDYRMGAIDGTYKPLALDIPLQTSNADGLYVTEIGIDNLKDKQVFAKTFSNLGTETNFFGAYHYLNTGLMIGTHGGGFDHHIRTNIFTYRFWSTLETKWYLYGCRLMFKYI